MPPKRTKGNNYKSAAPANQPPGAVAPATAPAPSSPSSLGASSTRPIDRVLRRRARAHLAALAAAGSTAVTRALMSHSPRRQRMAEELLEGTARLPDKLATSVRAGGNPFVVVMTAAHSKTLGSRAESRRKHTRKRAASQAAATKAKTKTKVAMRRGTAEASAAASAVGIRGTHAGSGNRRSAKVAAPSHALTARLRSVHAAHDDPQGKPKEPPPQRPLRELERKRPRHHRETTTASTDKSAAADTTTSSIAGSLPISCSPQPPVRWVRRCRSKTVRQVHKGLTLPRSLRRRWAVRASGMLQHKVTERAAAMSATDARTKKGACAREAPSVADKRDQRWRLLQRAAARVTRQTQADALVVKQANMQANAGVWVCIRETIVQRRAAVEQLLECRDDVGTTTPASTRGPVSEEETSRSGPLSLARLFPLFGLFVDVASLVVDTRHKRKSGLTVAHLSSTEPRCGVVVAESAAKLTVALLPREKDRHQFRAVSAYLLGVTDSRPPLESSSRQLPIPVPTHDPCLVHVRKWFPGSSGDAAQLLHRLLPRKPRSTSSCRTVAIVRGESLNPTGSSASHTILSCLEGRCL